MRVQCILVSDILLLKSAHGRCCCVWLSSTLPPVVERCMRRALHVCDSTEIQYPAPLALPSPSPSCLPTHSFVKPNTRTHCTRARLALRTSRQQGARTYRPLACFPPSELLVICLCAYCSFHPGPPRTIFSPCGVARLPHRSAFLFLVYFSFFIVISVVLRGECVGDYV